MTAATAPAPRKHRDMMPPGTRAILAEYQNDVRILDAKHAERHRLEAAFLAELEPLRARMEERFRAASERHEERLAQRRARDARARAAS